MPVQTRNQHDSWSFIQSMETLSKVVENLQNKIELQTSLLNSLLTKAEIHEHSLNNLQTKVDNQANVLNKLEADFEVQRNVLKNLVTKDDLEFSLMNNLAKNLTMTASGEEVEKLPTKTQTSSITKATVEGIVAGTWKGVLVIPLDSRQERTISSNVTSGVAFDWKTRKVYWIESGVQIKRSELDGSSVEILISGTSLFGLAVDTITGNFYYGATGSNARIIVCNRSGNKCAVVASGADIIGKQVWDIALSPSQGLMFWSSRDDKKSVTRANMDGTNATVIILENIYGLYVDEVAQKLYWTHPLAQIIGNHDFNGNNRNILLNTTNSAYDVVTDGDTLYYGSQSINDVYSLTQEGVVSPVANTTKRVRHMALYGRNKIPARPNPCESSPCPNLCVLSGVSYTCL